MKNRLTLFIAIILLAVGVTNAKNGKIKYGKYIYYEGEFINKQPMGRGNLVLMSPSDKNKIIALIVGEFEGCKIVDAEITSTLLPSIKTTGSQPIFISFESQEKMGKITTLTFNFSDVSFESDSLIYTFGKLNANLRIDNKSWKMCINEKDESSYMISVTTKDIPLPSSISQYWKNPSRILTFAELECGKITIPVSEVIYDFDGYYYSDDIEKDHDTSARVMFRNKYVSFASYRFYIDPNNSSWEGSRILADRTVIKGNDCKVEITSEDKGEYIGTLVDPMQPVRQSLTSFEELQFKTGTLKKDKNSVRYLNGESEEIIKARLHEQKLDDDLIESVITGSITESDAIDKQQLRDEEAARKREAENKELEAILSSRWDCKEIAFFGSISGTEEGDRVLRMLFNVDHTYFSGMATLALAWNGEGVFGVVVEPAAKAYGMGRGKALQITSLCKDFYECISGRWSLNGNDILIDGKKVATIGEDGKTVIYEGMFVSTMTIKTKK